MKRNILIGLGVGVAGLLVVTGVVFATRSHTKQQTATNIEHKNIEQAQDKTSNSKPTEQQTEASATTQPVTTKQTTSDATSPQPTTQPSSTVQAQSVTLVSTQTQCIDGHNTEINTYSDGSVKQVPNLLTTCATTSTTVGVSN